MEGTGSADRSSSRQEIRLAAIERIEDVMRRRQQQKEQAFAEELEVWKAKQEVPGYRARGRKE
jgi:hypothetical protein